MANKGQDKTKDTEKPKKKGKGILSRLIWEVILLIIGVGVPRLFALSPKLVDDIYTTRFYPAIRKLVWYLPSLCKVSFTEILFWLVGAAILLIIVIFVFKIFTMNVTFRGTVSFFCTLLLIAGIVLNIFNVTGGLNYHNQTLDKKYGLTVCPRTPTQLYGFCVYLRGQANTLREQVSTDERGIFHVDDIDYYLTKTASEVSSLAEINPWGDDVPAAKRFLLPQVFTTLTISGIFMPFFAETNVNTEQPSLLIPASAAHENSHYLGVAREDEANFTAFLACIQSEDVNIRYSGVMHALNECSYRLYNIDTNLYNELVNGYSEGVTDDILDYVSFWSGKDDTLFGKLSSVANDAYLKYNGTSGEQSYGETVDLMLAWYAMGKIID